MRASGGCSVTDEFGAMIRRHDKAMKEHLESMQEHLRRRHRLTVWTPDNYNLSALLLHAGIDFEQFPHDALLGWTFDVEAWGFKDGALWFTVGDYHVCFCEAIGAYSVHLPPDKPKEPPEPRTRYLGLEVG